MDLTSLGAGLASSLVLAVLLITTRARLVRPGMRVFLPICAAAVCLTVWGCPLQAQVAVALTRGPYVQLATTNSILVAWQTNVATASRVDYGLTSSLGQRLDDPTPTTRHAVTFTNLQPSTEYFYRVGSEMELLSSMGSFKTNPSDERPFRFCVFGDSGTGSEAQLAVAEQIKAARPDFCLHTGDVVYPDGRGEFFDPFFFVPYKDIIKSVVIYPSLGNHDVLTENGRPYLDAFYLPRNNPAQTERYYSFDYGGVYFVALDSNQSLAPGSTQLLWLRDDLARTRKRWKIIFFHHPPYSSSRHANDSDVLALRSLLPPTLDELKVDMVFNGHDHDFERSFPLRGGLVVDRNQEPNYVNPGGTIYVVSGGGGNVLYPAGSSFFTAFSQSAYHVTLVDVASDRLVVQAINSTGQVIDRMTLSKLNAVPTLTSLLPSITTAGSSDRLLSVTGSGFLPESVVRWNNSERRTTYISNTELVATIPATDLIAGGTVNVTVFNPPPGGGNSNPLTFTITDFSVEVSPASVAVNRGQPAIYTIRLIPQFGSFDATISLSCSNLPPLSSCSFSPSSLTPASSPGTSTLTVSTTVAFASLWPLSVRPRGAPVYALWLGLPGLGLVASTLVRKGCGMKPRLWLLVAMLICLLAAQVGCGVSSSSPQRQTQGTPSGSFNISVTAASGPLQHSAMATLIVR